MDVIDEVNALLKLGVGDPYRLEHIKQAYLQNNSIWVTDENYLKRLREKYILRHTAGDSITPEEEAGDTQTIHCWKCGRKAPIGANFCMICGTSLFEVDSNPKPASKSKPRTTSSSRSVLIKSIIIAIPILVLIVIGTSYTQEYFDDKPEDSDIVIPPAGENDSRCGPGTVFDSKTNSCILG